ncbi:MAG: hypothetical protein LBS05_00300 [Tannerellaceae bacterium]|jgi:hypothetical protein|nr:hypothetical protein [Tannerellaceae bacterium]
MKKIGSVVLVAVFCAACNQVPVKNEMILELHSSAVMGDERDKKVYAMDWMGMKMSVFHWDGSFAYAFPLPGDDYALFAVKEAADMVQYNVVDGLRDDDNPVLVRYSLNIR